DFALAVEPQHQQALSPQVSGALPELLFESIAAEDDQVARAHSLFGGGRGNDREAEGFTSPRAPLRGEAWVVVDDADGSVAEGFPAPGFGEEAGGVAA